MPSLASTSPAPSTGCGRHRQANAIAVEPAEGGASADGSGRPASSASGAPPPLRLSKRSSPAGEVERQPGRRPSCRRGRGDGNCGRQAAAEVYYALDGSLHRGRDHLTHEHPNLLPRRAPSSPLQRRLRLRDRRPALFDSLMTIACSGDRLARRSATRRLGFVTGLVGMQKARLVRPAADGTLDAILDHRAHERQHLSPRRIVSASAPPPPLPPSPPPPSPPPPPPLTSASASARRRVACTPASPPRRRARLGEPPPARIASRQE